MLAGAYLLLKQPKLAYGPLQSAVEVDPFDPRVHILWAEAAKRLGDKPVAAREERRLAGLSGRSSAGQFSGQADAAAGRSERRGGQAAFRRLSFGAECAPSRRPSARRGERPAPVNESKEAK